VSGRSRENEVHVNHAKRIKVEKVPESLSTAQRFAGSIRRLNVERLIQTVRGENVLDV
jgi:hypothetical protein